MAVYDYISLVALAIGTVYALYIAVSPFKPEYTWISVVIGVAMNLVFVGVWEYLDSKSLEHTSITFWFFSVTGFPMVLGQIIKHALQKREASKLRVEAVPNE